MTNPSDTPGRQPLASAPQSATALDTHGFDPTAYDWIPALRRPRADGWTHAKQRLFIETLADTASPRQAVDAVGLSVSSAYRLRRSPGGEAFAAAWDAAIQQASKRLIDIAYERAVDGSEDFMYDGTGKFLGRRRRMNDRLLMFLLRAHQPDRYRHADKATRGADEPPAPALPHVAQAVAALGPAVPDKPHETMDADDLESRMLTADIMNGELAHWHRAEAQPATPEPDFVDPHEREIDRRLDEIRRQNAPHWRPYEPDQDLDDPVAPPRRARRSRREL